jgi:hypothetical protein
MIQAAGLTEAVDVTRVVEVVTRRWGVPEDVGLHGVLPATDAAPVLVPAAAP